ncbi:hypothetical protein L6164_031700 [Bauhinia variegata]|uniref:Uncharacterized protein n=1 Tax=Bauhinia variegata TaxID=167791 RepID=A0ACB9LFW3_BAUVA|nr:hypothetical protein L6164_031700 [Bauhinia variegata]
MGAVIIGHMGAVQTVIIRRWDSIYQDLARAEYIIYEAGIMLSLLRGYNRLVAETESHPLASLFRNLATKGGFSYFEARHISRNPNYVAQIFSERHLWLNPAQGYLYLNETDIEDAFGSNALLRCQHSR